MAITPGTGRLVSRWTVAVASCLAVFALVWLIWVVLRVQPAGDGLGVGGVVSGASGLPLAFWAGRDTTRSAGATKEANGEGSRSTSDNQAPADGSMSGSAASGRKAHPVRFLIATVVLVVLAIAAGAAALSDGRYPEAAAEKTISYSFGYVSYPSGLLCIRSWVLGGTAGGTFNETLTCSASRQAVRIVVQEPIPASIAVSLASVRYTERPLDIDQKRHVVSWQLNVPARHSVSLGYTATVPSKGVTLARLESWVGAFNQLTRQLSAGSQVKWLSVGRRTIRLGAGKSIQLRLTGLLGNGLSVPIADLSKAIWTIADTNVAVVTSTGKVTGESPNRTRLKITLGDANLTVLVIVTGGAATGGAATGQPSVHTSNSPVTHSSGPGPSPTPTVTGHTL